MAPALSLRRAALRPPSGRRRVPTRRIAPDTAGPMDEARGSEGLDALTNDTEEAAAADRDGIERPVGGLTEARQLSDPSGLLPQVDGSAAHDAQAPDRAGAEVAEEVAAEGGGRGLAAVDVTARHRTALLVRVHADRSDQVAGGRRRAWGVTRTPFVDVPAVVRKLVEAAVRAEI